MGPWPARFPNFPQLKLCGLSCDITMAQSKPVGSLMANMPQERIHWLLCTELLFVFRPHIPGTGPAGRLHSQHCYACRLESLQYGYITFQHMKVHLLPPLRLGTCIFGKLCTRLKTILSQRTFKGNT